jgi:hypothetical protein
VLDGRGTDRQIIAMENQPYYGDNLDVLRRHIIIRPSKMFQPLNRVELLAINGGTCGQVF